MKIVFHSTDEDFVKNVNELRQDRKNHIDFITLVRNGRAEDVTSSPMIRADGWIEYNGWRHPAEEVTRVTVYFN